MSTGAADPPPRILIIEPNRRFCANLRAYTVGGWHDASVQSVGTSLESAARDRRHLNTFDVVIAAISFERDGTSSHPALRALQAMQQDSDAPAVILLADSGSEYTAVQALKAGAFDYLVKQHTSRELIINSIDRALRSRLRTPPVRSELSLYGYRIGQRLSASDAVSVHVAFSAERNEDVVVKILQRGRGSLALDVQFERFVDEFKILVDIDDRAVADIYDFRVTSQYCYIAMEYFRLGHVGGLLAGGRLEVPEALRLAGEIAQALSIIHMSGVVHRDLKPGNIMRRQDGSVALIDFGISQSTILALSRLDATAEPIAGTPYYMSPEQISGQPTDARADLYSLGVILYQMLTGEKPYVGESYDQIVAQHLDGRIPTLPAALSSLQYLIEALLGLTPDERLGSARELGELLDRERTRATGETSPPAAAGEPASVG